MSNVSRTIQVRTDSTPGASQDCSVMKAEGRTFIHVGVAADVVQIQVSNDDTNYHPLGNVAGVSDILTTNHRFLHTRSKLLAGSGGGSLILSGAEETTTPGPAGAPALGATTLTGTASTTDATATTIASFTPGGDGGFSVFGHLIGVKDDETVYSAIVAASWKRVAGTLTAIALEKVSETTSSLDPGDATATAVAGAARINVVGIAATNINWSFTGVLTTRDAF